MESVLNEQATVRVKEAMHVGLYSCPVETRLRGVAALMVRHQVHCIVVFDYGDEADEDRDLFGIVSDRAVASAFATGRIDELTAGAAAAAWPLLTVDSDDDLRRAAQLLAEHGASHLVVIDHASQRPVGMLSTLDLARSLSSAG